VEELQKIFDFTPEDLALNREGIVSQRQIRHLDFQRFPWPLAYVLLGVKAVWGLLGWGALNTPRKDLKDRAINGWAFLPINVGRLLLSLGIILALVLAVLGINALGAWGWVPSSLA
jgi:hypothetical protein